jgi:hypothetical protein
MAGKLTLARSKAGQHNYPLLVAERKPAQRLRGRTADATQNASTVCERATTHMLV